MEEKNCNFRLDLCKSRFNMHLTIPSMVSEIQGHAFDNCQFQSITIPSSVRHIEECAFDYCYQLESIEVDPESDNYYAIDGVLFQKHPSVLLRYPIKKTDSIYIVPQGIESIAESAFESNEYINSIVLPSSLKTIKDRAFYYCTNLKEISFPETLESIGCDAFACNSMKYVSLPEGLTTIEFFLFYQCQSLVEVQIPSSVKQINYDAFQGCINLERLSLSENVTYISSYNLRNPNMRELIVSPENKSYRFVDGALYSYDMSVLVGLLPIYDKDCFVVPETVQVVDNMAFSNCKNITTIVLPSKLKHIGMCAFQSCANLKQITIPEDVESIGEYYAPDEYKTSLQYNDSELEDNYLYDSFGEDVYDCQNYVQDNGVEQDDFSEQCDDDYSDTPLEVNAFLLCCTLERIDVDENNANYCSQDGVLFSKDMSTLICFPQGKKVSEYRIPDGVTCIGNSAFTNCDQLKSVVIPNSVTTIQNWAFCNCTQLEPLQLPPSVKKIAPFALEIDPSEY